MPKFAINNKLVSREAARLRRVFKLLLSLFKMIHELWIFLRLKIEKVSKKTRIRLVVMTTFIFFLWSTIQQGRKLRKLESKVTELERVDSISNELKGGLNKEIEQLKQVNNLLKINDAEFLKAKNEAVLEIASLVDEKAKIFEALESNQQVLDTIDVRVELLELNEDQQNQREVLLYLEENKRGMQILRSSLGTRLIVQVKDYEVKTEDGVVLTKLILINPEGGTQKGIKFLTRAYTHQLVSDLGEGRDEKPYSAVGVDIDLPSGTQTEIELLVPWVEEDSPLVALQLKNLSLDFYGFQEAK